MSHSTKIAINQPGPLVHCPDQVQSDKYGTSSVKGLPACSPDGVIHYHGRSMSKLMLHHCLVSLASFLLALGICGTLEWHKQNSHEICLCNFTILVLVNALQHLQAYRVIEDLSCSQPKHPPSQRVQ